MKLLMEMDNSKSESSVPLMSTNTANLYDREKSPGDFERWNRADPIQAQNPLLLLTEEQTVSYARLFAESHGLAIHADLFGRAALVARQPQALHDLPESERNALEYERDHKWHGPAMLWYSVALCALGAATQGWDQTGANGANLSFPQEFGIDGEGKDEWILGLINSVIFLSAGLVGVWVVDPLNYLFGRRGEIFITACCLIATPIASAFATSWQELFIARFFMGIGLGAKNATVPMYSAEMAPARIRGALVMFWQLWVGIGVFLGHVANVAVKDVGKISWRLQLGSAFIPAFLLAIGIFFCPESPRWLMKHGKHAKAFQSMCSLRAHPIIAARDLYYSWVLYEKELKEDRSKGYFSRLWSCFSVPRIRRANYGATTLMLAQQMCGINIIAFYSSTIFLNAGYTVSEALYASLGCGALGIFFAIPALFLIDSKGRRTMTLISFPLMFVFLLATGLSLLNEAENRVERVAPVTFFIYLFIIAYGLGEGPVAFVYAAEVFPTAQREQGMAWSVSVNHTFAGALSLGFPRMKTIMTPTGAFGFYAGLNLVAFVMVFCFVRETKRKTLEELGQVFSVPTKKYISLETKAWIVHPIKRCFFRHGVSKK